MRNQELEQLVLSDKWEQDLLRDELVGAIYQRAEVTAREVTREERRDKGWEHKLDDIFTSKWLGFPVMLLMLGGVFWITIKGANVPSALLNQWLFSLEPYLSNVIYHLGVSTWVHDLLVFGIFRTVAWVVSVMLPPMAIFFPLFTLLEDFGYLPRVAFNMDRVFKCCGCHGKQALTMCMGFGCNAAGVISCRIIDSERERLIAILTNNFVPCNGKFPTLIALASIFSLVFAQQQGGSLAIGLVVCCILLGIMTTLAVSYILSKTLLRGIPSSFALELPPYRPPQVGKVIIRSIFDRTVFVLGRAVVICIPAGAITWILANTIIGEMSILNHIVSFLDPFARLIGLDGFILMAFILGLPANEIVMPILIMSYMMTGVMVNAENTLMMNQLFLDQGWTWVTVVCTMLFALMHFPCGTTLWTIMKETKSWKWTLWAFMIPTLVGILLCFIVCQGARLLGIA